jgi:outer membrane protein OmpA-like peptidoglycan-associated protein
MRALPCLAAAVLVLVATPASGQERDVEGSKDHPMFSRFPGYYVTTYDEQEFGAHTIYLPDGSEKRIEGRYWQISYELMEGRRKGGPIEIGRNYLKLMTDRRGVRVADDLAAGGGRLAARMPVANKTLWLDIAVSNGGEVYELTIVEEAAMAQKVEFTAAELANLLNARGSVALHGILFDTGKATIKPESAGPLGEVIALLEGDPALALAIHGHTDNVGAAAANLRLSQDRAAAVKAYLVRGGIDAGRLATGGFGDTKPVADNRREDGRAQNRRVELVKQ